MLFYRHDASPSPSKGYINIRITADLSTNFWREGGGVLNVLNQHIVLVLSMIAASTPNMLSAAYLYEEMFLVKYFLWSKLNVFL